MISLLNVICSQNLLKDYKHFFTVLKLLTSVSQRKVSSFFIHDPSVPAASQINGKSVFNGFQITPDHQTSLFYFRCRVTI